MTSGPASTTDTEALPLWDEDTALASVGGDTAMARGLLAQLCASLTAELATMQDALASGDLSALAETAHHINGGAAYCGVAALRASLWALERRARAGDQAGARAALSMVAAEMERLIAFEQTSSPSG